MTTIITQTTGTTTEVHETAVAEAVAKGETQPKDGLRGLASRMRRAFGREKAESAPLPAMNTELGASRVSVQALARSLLEQDRTGEPLEAEEEQALLDAEAAHEAEEAESAEVEEPKTVPRAKSVPPPLPMRAAQDSSPALEVAVPVETAADATEPVAPSRAAQLRARLAAAKAQRAQALAMLAEAPSEVSPSEADAEPEELEAAAAVEDVAQSPAEDLEGFEDLEASALVEEPVSATR